ncbi:MAG: nucleotidyltransferase family protein [bacterium]|nr:nucleotidyltransferase family protein [bacterium]MDY4099289.1 nucleotidyltransferase family protein [Lachnospiraceae bacterium]
MKVCGIIAEYNPFHSGHAYQIAQARRQSGCDYVITVMSGDFVQRGAPALMDKYARARMALFEGADLVLMLPVYGSTASAEGFAQAGVAALLSTGVVDAISFGCEDPAICSEPCLRLAQELALECPEFQSALSMQLATGIPYAQARVKAVRSCYGADFDLSLFDTPNNLLAFEYMRALAHFRANPELCPVKRLGSYHATDHPGSDGKRLVGELSPASFANDSGDKSPAGTVFTSASACRTSLLSDPVKELPALKNARQIPTEVCRLLADYAHSYEFLQEDDLSQILHYALLAQKDPGYEAFLDCGCDLSSRIGNHLDSFASFSQFCDLIKNKSVTRARISRVLTHVLLQLPSEMPVPLAASDGTLPYLRVLGFRQSAAPLLHEIKQHANAPLITRIPEAERMLSAETMLYFRQDLFAGEVYRNALLHKCGHCYPDDYRRRIEIV